jgi:hypothetical protein
VDDTAKHRMAKAWADGRTCRGPAAANPSDGTYEFGMDLTPSGSSLAAYKNVTYGESGQKAGASLRGKQTT